ncbi:MAG TPA: sigma-70 family RNA polymerase sigma factor [Candidatus Binataceae bacterium]|nr:sigma-70 family RNA polymerase sigma factor [Candidatus Binataceae bacterium]
MVAEAAEFRNRYAAAIELIYRKGAAAKWNIDLDTIANALVRAAGASDHPEQLLISIRAGDFALAVACREGIGAAWEHLIATLRPSLYASARAIAGDESRGRELADSVWADLYGLEVREGRRRSLFDYYHGRSTILTWLRAVLAQRHVDYHRSAGRIDSLDGMAERKAEAQHAAQDDDPPEPERARYVAMLGLALDAALKSLTPRDRMRLGYYYRHNLSLKEIGRLMGEHESNVSRKLARSRADIKSHVERALSEREKLSREQILLCYDFAAGDLPLDLDRVFSGEK